jgi:hypothetical protein
VLHSLHRDVWTIEIDSREAVSRFLNVHAGNRADHQSISKCAREIYPLPVFFLVLQIKWVEFV